MPDTIAPDFAPFEARMRREGIAQIVIDNFRHYYGVLAGGSDLAAYPAQKACRSPDTMAKPVISSSRTRS